MKVSRTIPFGIAQVDTKCSVSEKDKHISLQHNSCSYTKIHEGGPLRQCKSSRRDLAAGEVHPKTC